MAIQYSFERIEKKYLIDEQTAQLLTRRLAPYTDREIYGRHSVLNIYFDTPDFALIRHSLEKPAYKEKFRLRCYGVPGESGTVFAEVKKKYRGVVYKRRIAAPPADIERFLAGEFLPEQDALNQREIRCFLSRWQPEPRAFIAYDREAFLGRSDMGLRITFDRNLRWRADQLSLRQGDGGTALLPAGRVIMEIKMPLAAPLWLSHMLSEMKILPHSFSKYGTLYSDVLRHQVAERMKISC